ncbi:MAG: DNA translocase FtsK 4TM domain-containing protein [Phycisphaerae bacterium]
MSRAEQRQAALHLCLVAVAWIAAVFGWVAVLSFNVADPPSTSAFPPNDPLRNLCGSVGADIAHTVFYYLGFGAYGFALLVTVGLVAWSRRIQVSDLWMRCIGLGLVVTVVSTLADIFIVAGDAHLVTGPGGVLGVVVAAFLKSKLQLAGTLITLAAGLIVGLLLAADQLVVKVAKGAGEVGKKSGGALLRSSAAAIAGAGAAVAQGMSNMTARVATAGAPVGEVDEPVAAPIKSPRVERTTTKPAASTPATDATGASTTKPPRVEPSVRIDTPVIDKAKSAAAENPIEAAPGEAKADAKSAAKSVPVRPAQPPAGQKALDFAGPSIDDDADVDATAADDVDDDIDHETLPAIEPISAAKPGATNGTLKPAGPPRVTQLGGGAPTTPPRSIATYPAKVGNHELPSITTLDDPDPINKDEIETLCREKAYILEQTLQEFRLDVQVVGIETGPVITVFELKLAAGVKVSQIASLSNDMARALKAPAVRVVAPLPSKNTIGIEVPNIDKEKVRLKDLMRSVGQRADGYAIPLFLGKDASGAPLIADLAKMPHCLIAGTTGSGKSVCISSVIMSILLTRTPDEINLVLVDPKVVELAMFKDIPHLISPIVTEMSKAEAILDWAATKMDERYELLAEAGVKEIRGYNKLGPALLRERMHIESDEEMARIPLTLPYIVIIIDELADLMMTAAKEVEFYLCRLAQKSRAVGIHLIVSTQRPQANVVTGLIKSNLPSRIAFRVASRLDSRIVLDQNGGEVLMGQGDMLFLPPGQSKLVRAQGTYISDEELRAVVEHAKKQGEPRYHPELMRMPKLSGDGAEERDELFDQAVDVMLETGRGSVSLLQRRLTIGYSRASRLVEQMYAAGIVGEYKGSQAREVMISKEEWQNMRGMRDREEAAEE